MERNDDSRLFGECAARAGTTEPLRGLWYERDNDARSRLPIDNAICGREVLSRAVQGPSFTMVEIQTAPIGGDLVGYRFCDSWAMHVIGSCQLIRTRTITTHPHD